MPPDAYIILQYDNWMRSRQSSTILGAGVTIVAEARICHCEE